MPKPDRCHTFVRRESLPEGALLKPEAIAICYGCRTEVVSEEEIRAMQDSSKKTSLCTRLWSQRAKEYSRDKFDEVIAARHQKFKECAEQNSRAAQEEPFDYYADIQRAAAP